MKSIHEDKVITVVGTGSAAYLAIAYFHKYLSNPIVWYKPDSPAIGVGEATTPGVLAFLKKIDIDERVVINTLNGSTKLGIKFEDFVKEGHTYLHPFGNFRDEWCMNYELMRDDCILQNFSQAQAVHFDIANVYPVLDERFKTFERLTIVSDFYEYNDDVKNSIVIDCTGFKRAIVSKMPDFEFIDITHKILNDQAYVYRGEYTDRVKQKKPYSTMKGRDYGWMWHIPLNNRISLGYVHNSKYDVKQEFINYLENYFGHSIDPNDIDTLRMTSGRNNKNLFEHNSNLVVSLGLSSAFIEPMESTGLWFTVSGIQSMTEVLKGNRSIDQHNEMVSFSYDSSVKFIILHYALSQRTNEYWEHYRNLDPSTYTKETNSCWFEQNWEIVTNGMLEKQFEEDFKMKDIRLMIELKKNKVPYYNFDVAPQLEDLVLNKNMEDGEMLEYHMNNH
jgi:tryptophan halogenase